ncbi:RhuM family protein [Sulfurovum sp.]|uniref:RhuM family protein n=1 Tax=Sulfurovum sp. TaxID=1969726 RepID=UPI0025FFBCFC|nr:RhuM family protein [Sulfurovum sp.]
MSEMIIYEDGNVSLEVSFENKTVWLDANDIAAIFDVNRPAIVKHIGNIYKSGELEKKSTCSILEQVAKDGKKRKKNFYNLDMIISVGYRVNSKKATYFRRWATDVLNRYLLQGYALDHERLQKEKFAELERTIETIKQAVESRALAEDEAKGFIEIIGNYAKSWALLQGYDEQTLPEVTETQDILFALGYDEAKEAIAALKETLMSKGEATVLFGQEKAGEFKGNLLNIYQSFGGEDLLPSVEQKAANLLYYVVKGHPFNDGNKRIGAYLFVLFLHKNGILHKANGEAKINDNALAALTLLVATSMPEQKEIIIRLVMNMLVEGV